MYVYVFIFVLSIASHLHSKYLLLFQSLYWQCNIFTI